MEREKQRWEKEKSQLKASIEENKERMLKLESYWIEAQTLCHTVNEHLKEAQAQYQALEKKYNKAKKLIKDFQQKWVNHRFSLWSGYERGIYSDYNLEVENASEMFHT